MTALFIGAGLLLVVVALVDLGWTTVAAGSGGGPMTRWVSRFIWWIALIFHWRRPSHRMLSATGVMIVFAVLAVWIALLLTGWSLVFSSTEGAVRELGGSPADGVSRVYFAGYSVFTLGNGDFRPGHGAWQVATVAASGTGLVLITLSITYLVPVASAVSDRRTLASYIASLGASPEEIVTASWTGRAFGGLPHHLAAIVPLIHAARQQHLTYPVLHYFNSADRESAAAPNFARLSQAVDLLRYGVAPECRPDQATLRVLERSIDAFMETLAAAYIRPLDEPLPAGELDGLRQCGIPTVTDHEYEEALAGIGSRRHLLAGYLANHGWWNAPGHEAS